MPTLYDLAYHTLLTLSAPVLWTQPRLRSKLARARRQRNGDVPARAGEHPCVLIHAVSVGEVNATREMVAGLLEGRAAEGVRPGDEPRPGYEPGAAQRLGKATAGELHVVVSVTTDTGFERARQLFEASPFAGRVSVVRYPLDFSKHVRRFLDRLGPDVAVLMELEVWPNFVRECSRRGIPVVLVNGRVTERSYRAYRRFRPLVRPMYSRLSAVCAQEQTHAQRFIDLGVPPERVSVTGTMKFDSAHLGERVEGDEELARQLRLKPLTLGGDEPVLVCGSTGPGEEALLLQAYALLRQRHPRLRLAIVPRKPERFDEVAKLMTGQFEGNVIRRSNPSVLVPSASNGALILGDTMGELRKFYSLADLVVVGRTLIDLGEKQHGSDMIEPAALGKPVVVGPFWGNFAEPMHAFLAADAIRQVGEPGAPPEAPQLAAALDQWLSDPAAGANVGARARDVVLSKRGATARHVSVILEHLRQSLATVASRGPAPARR